jgi:hypothetical protein
MCRVNISRLPDASRPSAFLTKTGSIQSRLAISSSHTGSMVFRLAPTPPLPWTNTGVRAIAARPESPDLARNHLCIFLVLSREAATSFSRPSQRQVMIFGLAHLLSLYQKGVAAGFPNTNNKKRRKIIVNNDY